MTESVDENMTAEDLEPLPQPDHDGTLANLVTLTNLGIIDNTSITLTMSGTVVSGALVSLEKFFRGTLDLLPAENREGWAKVFEVELEAAQALKNGDPVVNFPAFIHLQDAYAVTPTGSVKLSIWRGRLTEVSGWNLGQIKPAE